MTQFKKDDRVWLTLPGGAGRVPGIIGTGAALVHIGPQAYLIYGVTVNGEESLYPATMLEPRGELPMFGIRTEFVYEIDGGITDDDLAVATGYMHDQFSRMNVGPFPGARLLTLLTSPFRPKEGP